jgi:hypothetical protein
MITSETLSTVVPVNSDKKLTAAYFNASFAHYEAEIYDNRGFAYECKGDYE